MQIKDLIFCDCHTFIFCTFMFLLFLHDHILIFYTRIILKFLQSGFRSMIFHMTVFNSINNKRSLLVSSHTLFSYFFTRMYFSETKGFSSHYVAGECFASCGYAALHFWENSHDSSAFISFVYTVSYFHLAPRRLYF